MSTAPRMSPYSYTANDVVGRAKYAVLTEILIDAMDIHEVTSNTYM